jgi:hypothetical protein
MNKKKYSLGGFLSVLNTVMALTQDDGRKQAMQMYKDNITKVSNNSNPYGLELGGNPRGFNQYDAPSHQDGGRPINQEGNVTSQGTNEIEGKENKYTYSNLPDKAGSTYVFSDVNKTSQMVRDIIKKYKDSDQDEVSRNQMEFEINKVENKNEVMNQIRNTVDQFMMQFGGPTDPTKEKMDLQTDTTMSQETTRTTNPDLAISESEAIKKKPKETYSKGIGKVINDTIDDLLGQPRITTQLDETTNRLNARVDEYNKIITNNNLEGKIMLDNNETIDTRKELTYGSELGDPVPELPKIPTLVPSLLDTGDKKLSRFNILNNAPSKFSTPSTPSTSTPSKSSKSSTPSTPSTYGTYSPYSPTSDDTNTSKFNTADLLRAAGFAGSAFDAFGKADKDIPIIPDTQKSDEQFYSMNTNLDQARQDAVEATNRGSELNRNAASSFSQFRARELNNLGNLRDTLSNIGMQEQQLRNQINQTRGQYEYTKAAQEAQIRDNVQQRNLQNDAMQEDLRRQFFSDIVAEADRLDLMESNSNLAKAKIAEGIQIMKMVAPDFDINADMVKNILKVSKGDGDVSELTGQELIIYKRLKK